MNFLLVRRFNPMEEGRKAICTSAYEQYSHRLNPQPCETTYGSFWFVS